MSEQTLLFMKTGVLCSEPLQFYDRLAEMYDADLHATDDVHIELSNGGWRKDKGFRHLVNQETERRTKESLQNGVNVVYEGFLNTRSRRSAVREIAAQCGARAVLLVMYTPMRTIESTIRMRHAADELSIPNDLVSLDDSLQVARRMRRSIEWPRDDEEHITLRGLHGAQVLLDRVARVVPLPCKSSV